MVEKIINSTSKSKLVIIMSKRKRDIFIRFMVDEAERDMINRRMEQTGIKNRRA